MLQAAEYGQTAVCEYLHEQQCSRDAVACFAAALHCRVGTLQWLLKHGYPSNELLLLRAAAVCGHIAVLSYLSTTDSTSCILRDSHSDAVRGWCH
eukprot:1853-Heterococcus_DN1.PRE.3